MHERSEIHKWWLESKDSQSQNASRVSILDSKNKQEQVP